ncbi:MAG: Acetyl-CoA acetyltransferase [Myxococcota bacterium]|nr:Acetyl-CoA acetyltransferase [Myxococcota bacterium]
MKTVVIVSATRTAIASFQGALAPLSAPKLGAAVIRSAIDRARLTVEQVDEVFMGQVLQAGVGQAPARQAALGAGLPYSVPCTTINKVCGSGLKAIINGAQAIMTGDASVVVAGGQESMSNTPYYLPKARNGYRMGHGEILDGMIKDGLWDVYNNYHMGNAAELCAREMKISREAQDAFAAESYKRALAAIQSGAFREEITPVEVPQGKGDSIQFAEDEEPGRGKPEKFPSLKPVFDKAGTVTAANASSINDGAAAVVLADEEFARQNKLPVLARIHGWSSAAQAPEWFTTAPAKAIGQLHSRLGWNANTTDLYEINEAFSVVSIACNTKLELDPAKVNVNGGAVALGHPIGASGARLAVTLIHALKARGKSRGIVSLCIGGGEGIALGLEV